MKPLFTDQFCAFPKADDVALATLVKRVLRPGCRIVEVGSWLGTGSTQTLLREISKVAGARLLCVDTWRGSRGVRRHEEMLRSYDVLATFRANTSSFSGLMDIMIADSVTSAQWLADASFDLVFLDADHRYSAVKNDIAAWRTKVRPGGILCGHDCERRPTQETIDFVRRSPDADTGPAHQFKFAEVHHGCVLAVHEAFNGTAQLMAETCGSSIWFTDDARKSTKAPHHKLDMASANYPHLQGGQRPNVW